MYDFRIMSIFWVLFLTLLLRNSSAVDEELTRKDELERKDCPADSCGSNLHPIPISLRKRARQHRPARIWEHQPDVNYYLDSEEMKTNFSCDEKPYIPGFYADMETECQIFHFCANGVSKHYKCPYLSAFNQQSLLCQEVDKVQCQLSPEYYAKNANLHPDHPVFEGVRDYLFSNASHRYDFVLEDSSNEDHTLESNLAQMLRLILVADSICKSFPHLLSLLPSDWKEKPEELLRYLNSERLCFQALARFFPLPVESLSFQSMPEQDSSEQTRSVSGRAATSNASAQGQSTGQQNPAGTVDPILQLNLDFFGLVGKTYAAATCAVLQNELTAKIFRGIVNNTLTRLATRLPWWLRA